MKFSILAIVVKVQVEYHGILGKSTEIHIWGSHGSQVVKAAYKRLLVHNEAEGSTFGNCTILDNITNLSVTENTKDSVINLESTWLTFHQ